jgi:acyl-CoA hydrolase
MTSHAAAAPIRLIDVIFPGDANHHGTLFGGVALAHMDKVAFLTASPRHFGLKADKAEGREVS